MEESISLDRNSQGKFKKNVNRLKRDIKKGKVIVKEKRLKRQKNGKRVDRGVIYLGHIPHGFYENEMRDFFKQFGIVTRVKVCRSEKTGRSKSYGYVEFLHPEVAKIAAETMNNYLMFKRRLVAQYIPPEKQKRLNLNKTVNPEDPPLLRSRTREIKNRNKNINETKYKELCKKTVRSVRGKLKKLESLGIQHIVTPVDAPKETVNALKIPQSQDIPKTHTADHRYKTVDSDIKIRVESSSRKQKTPVSTKAVQKKKEISTKSAAGKTVQKKKGNSVKPNTKKTQKPK